MSNYKVKFLSPSGDWITIKIFPDVGMQDAIIFANLLLRLDVYSVVTDQNGEFLHNTKTANYSPLYYNHREIYYNKKKELVVGDCYFNCLLNYRRPNC